MMKHYLTKYKETRIHNMRTLFLKQGGKPLCQKRKNHPSLDYLQP